MLNPHSIHLHLSPPTPTLFYVVQLWTKFWGLSKLCSMNVVAVWQSPHTGKCLNMRSGLQRAQMQWRASHYGAVNRTTLLLPQCPLEWISHSVQTLPPPFSSKISSIPCKLFVIWGCYPYGNWFFSPYSGLQSVPVPVLSFICSWFDEFFCIFIVIYPWVMCRPKGLRTIGSETLKS